MRERFEKELEEALREKEETIQELKGRQGEERQMREMYEVMGEVERRLMKIILPEICNNFMTSQTKMQREFDRQLEEKNREMTSLRKELEEMNKHCSDLEEKNRETSAAGPTLPVRRRWSSNIPPISGPSLLQEMQGGSTTSDVPDAFNEVLSWFLSSSSEEEEDEDSDAVYLRPCCENCKHFQSSYGNEKIIPEKLSRGRLRAQLKEGVYECVFTGLIFEALVPVLVRYSVLSWSTFSKFLQDPWTIAGPIFNVQTDNKDASALKSIQLPHSLCLAGQDNEIAFGILHITGKHPVIERVEYSGSHLKWLVTSLSPFGSIFLKTLVKPHGAVLVYKDLCSIDESHTFRIYLTVNSPSHINDIFREVHNSSRSYMRIEKNTNTVPLEESKYHLMSKPGGEIEPEDLMFTQETRTLIGYYEAYYDQPPPFKFHLKASGTDIIAWSATIRPGDLVGTTEKKTSKEEIYKHDQFAFPEDGKNTESILLRRRTNTMEIPPDRISITAKEMITQNKTTLQRILMADISQVIQCVFEAHGPLLVGHEYNNLRSISSPSEAAIQLVDKMIFKGETTCKAFLCLLQDTKLTGMFPDLKTMPWYKSPVQTPFQHSVQHPVESASVHSRSSRSKSTPRCSVFWILLFICTVFFFICLAYFFKGNIIDSLT